MPELPEIETLRRGLEPRLTGREVVAVTVRRARLRRPLPGAVRRLAPAMIRGVGRRAKYLLLDLERGFLLFHLGMSGVLRLVPAGSAAGRHDHLDFGLDNGWLLRFCDPRRFGLIAWQPGRDPLRHPLLSGLGPEPLADDFDGETLWRLLHRRPGAIKPLLMNGALVAGVGNIYASEALHRAGIHPQRAARRIARARYRRLAGGIRDVLAAAVAAGGTTLRDFYDADRRPGYFSRELQVYDRAGLPCPRCAAAIRRLVQAGRATYYCPACQH